MGTKASHGPMETADEGAPLDTSSAVRPFGEVTPQGVGGHCRLQQPHGSSFDVQGPCKPGPTGATSRCMTKILAVIFPAKETAIKFTARSQRRNSCKQVTFALSFGERTMSGEQGETRAHLTALRMGFTAAPCVICFALTRL